MLPAVDTTITTSGHLDATSGSVGAMHMPSVDHAVLGRRETNSIHLVSFECSQIDIVDPAIDNTVAIEIVFRPESAICLHMQPLVCETVTV